MTASADFDPEAFIRKETRVASPVLLPGIKLHLAGEDTPLWRMTGERLKNDNLAPPFWAFAWPGGQGVARYLLDHPEVANGKRVLDFAAGSGIGAIAAMQAGARQALAVDIDRLALVAINLNAALNNVKIDVAESIDFSQPPPRTDLIIVGDACYQQAMAAGVMRWLWLCKAAGLRVIMGDTDRAYVPQGGLTELASYIVPTSRDLEPDDHRLVRVYDVGVPEET